jgi:putative selenium metabolism hydrolase
MADTIPFDKIRDLAEQYKPDMTRFLRDMVRIPSESCNEGGVIACIKAEMEKVGFDKVEIDPMGNVLGTIGHGSRVIAMDAHIDTVGVGDYTLIVTGTVQEEDCDGLCWQYIHKELGITPEFVVSTEPTDGGIYRGQRGRMEIRVDVKGVSSHGSAPERGDNAIFKMGRILGELEELHGRLKDDPFLGKGSLTVSEIFFTSPSRCAVADGCSISVDRRLTFGEDAELAMNQIRDLPAAKAAGAVVSMYKYDRPAYTGLVYPTDCYFPTWVIPAEHVAFQSAADTYRELFNAEPRLDKWTFSTNGVSIMGMFGIPCIGFGPGKEKEAHAPNEKTWKEDLVRCAAFYATMPLIHLRNNP